MTDKDKYYEHPEELFQFVGYGWFKCKKCKSVFLSKLTLKESRERAKKKNSND